MPIRLRTHTIGIAWMTAVFVSIAALTGCSPAIGGEAWREKLKETPKLDWSPRNASDFAKHCLFK